MNNHLTNKLKTAEEAVALIQNGDSVFLQSAASTPTVLIDHLAQRNDIDNLEIVSIHTEGSTPYATEKFEHKIKINTFFVGSNIREAVKEGRANYIPMFLSEIPLAFQRGIIPIDVALVQVSPPDRHGYCSLGVSVDVSNAAIHKAKIVIAQLNPNVPRTFGDGIIHVSKIDALVEVDRPLFRHDPKPISEMHMKIGQYIAELIEDGATLQTGIGAIPDAALACLTNHKNLGMHTEMFSDGIIELVEKGILNGKLKNTFKEKIVTGFALGSQKLYDYVHDNPLFEFRDTAFVNDTKNIRSNPKVTAINSAIEVDIFGQVCADSIGPMQYSGVGGQMDFIRGAALSEGGKPIIALPSITSKGKSKIVSTLARGASVVTTRAHVHWIVTENGSIDLYGKNLRERAKALINIAHPDHQEALEKSAFEILGEL